MSKTSDKDPSRSGLDFHPDDFGESRTRLPAERWQQAAEAIRSADGDLKAAAGLAGLSHRVLCSRAYELRRQGVELPTFRNRWKRADDRESVITDDPAAAERFETAERFARRIAVTASRLNQQAAESAFRALWEAMIHGEPDTIARETHVADVFNDDDDPRGLRLRLANLLEELFGVVVVADLTSLSVTDLAATDNVGAVQVDMLFRCVVQFLLERLDRFEISQED